MAKLAGYMSFDGAFIKRWYNELYSKTDMDKICDDDMYEVHFYHVEIPDMYQKYTKWGESVDCFKIPDISNTLQMFEYNTSSAYAMELCNYEFIDNDD